MMYKPENNMPGGRKKFREPLLSSALFLSDYGGSPTSLVSGHLHTDYFTTTMPLSAVTRLQKS